MAAMAYNFGSMVFAVFAIISGVESPLVFIADARTVAIAVTKLTSVQSVPGAAD
jgi:hypothetical protein